MGGTIEDITITMGGTTENQENKEILVRKLLNRSLQDLLLLGAVFYIGLVILASLYTAFHSSPNPPVKQGLLARWVFHSNLGNKAKDVSNQAHSGFINQPSWEEGRGYLALKFDGEKTYIQVPYRPDLSLGGDFTMAGWIKPESNRERQVLFQKQAKGRQEYPPITFYAPWGAGRLGLVLSDGQRRVGFLSDNSIRGNKWHHIAVTFNETLGRIKFFIDGELAGDKQTSVKPAGSEGKLFMGAGSFSGKKDFYYQGLIDSLNLYNQALSQSELTKLIKSD